MVFSMLFVLVCLLLLIIVVVVVVYLTSLFVLFAFYFDFSILLFIHVVFNVVSCPPHRSCTSPSANCSAASC